MFDAVEKAAKIDKAEFEAAATVLRTRLLGAQRRLAGADFPVILLVSGVEAAGKSAVVNRLHEWLDPRGLQTVTLWRETDEERLRPHWWRHWRRLPAAGQIGLFFGSWYTHPISEQAAGRITSAQFATELARIAAFERMLAAEGALLVKLWFHLAKGKLRKRLTRLQAVEGRKPSRYEKAWLRHYPQFIAAAGDAIRASDHGAARWHLIDAGRAAHRDLSAGRVLQQALERRLRRRPRPVLPVAARTPRPSAAGPLSGLDLGATVGKSAYREQLKALQRRLHRLSWQAHDAGRSAVAVFEGWDAAGKGGVIRRLTQAMDARLYRVIPIAAPSDEERAHHYLWRFWRHLPMDGAFTLFDRSWYGRVLVERVEGFARPAQWRRAYGEINDFEAQLAEHGVRVFKFWLHISADEQLRRFRARGEVAHKRHKITDEDWRNRERWGDYEAAVDDMVRRTDTAWAPWTLVPGECKRHARLMVLRTVCEGLEAPDDD